MNFKLYFILIFTFISSSLLTVQATEYYAYAIIKASGRSSDRFYESGNPMGLEREVFTDIISVTTNGDLPKLLGIGKTQEEGSYYKGQVLTSDVKQALNFLISHLTDLKMQHKAFFSDIFIKYAVNDGTKDSLNALEKSRDYDLKKTGTFEHPENRVEIHGVWMGRELKVSAVKEGGDAVPPQIVLTGPDPKEEAAKKAKEEAEAKKQAEEARQREIEAKKQAEEARNREIEAEAARDAQQWRWCTEDQSRLQLCECTKYNPRVGNACSK